MPWRRVAGLSLTVVGLSAWGPIGEETGAEPLWLTLPVALLLVAVPVGALAAIGSWIRRLSRRWTGGWPVAPWFDLRHTIALLPLLLVALVATVIWVVAGLDVAVGYRRPGVQSTLLLLAWLATTQVLRRRARDGGVTAA